MDRRKIYSFIGVIPVLLVVFVAACTSAQYQPNWNSIDSRPLPAWYDQSKFGIFIHWGVFSVPSFSSEWFWWGWKGAKQADIVKFMEENYRPGFTYADFASSFKAEFFDPDQWADILKASGAKYVVLTSKHHEGFTNWPSKYSWNWNSMDVGPKRNLVGDLAAAVRNRTDIHFGLYHSLFEWFNPLYLQDKANKFTTQEYCEKVLWPELMELVNTFEPDVLWSDGDWEAPDTYWNSTEFLAWLYNSSPVKDKIVTNDRWGAGDSCKHGGYYTCQDRFNPVKDKIVTNDRWGVGDMCHHGGYYTCEDRFNPGTLTSPVKDKVVTNDRWGVGDMCNHGGFYTCGDRFSPGVLQKHKWENAMTIDKTSWGFRRNAPLADYLDMDELIELLASTVSCNGNLLMNIGPTADGRIVPIFEERLRSMGDWLNVNGEAIFETRPWRAQNDTLTKGVWYTNKTTGVYAIVLDWPADNQLHLAVPVPTSGTSLYMLGYNQPLKWTGTPSMAGITVVMPQFTPATMPCEWAWVIKMKMVQ